MNAQAPRNTLGFFIRLYQVGLSCWWPSSCKFMPTCSEYAQEAITLHGACRGMRLGIKRLLKCHPFHGGGFDPVPPQV